MKLAINKLGNKSTHTSFLSSSLSSWALSFLFLPPFSLFPFLLQIFIKSQLNIQNCAGMRKKADTTSDLMEPDRYNVFCEEVQCDREACPWEVNLVCRIPCTAEEFKTRGKQRRGGERKFPGDREGCMKILEQGRLGFKNKMNIIHNNKSRVQQMAEIKRESNARQREVSSFVCLGRHFGLFP